MPRPCDRWLLLDGQVRSSQDDVESESKSIMKIAPKIQTLQSFAVDRALMLGCPVDSGGTSLACFASSICRVSSSSSKALCSAAGILVADGSMLMNDFNSCKSLDLIVYVFPGFAVGLGLDVAMVGRTGEPFGC